jgi:hypothetical protein
MTKSRIGWLTGLCAGVMVVVVASPSGYAATLRAPVQAVIGLQNPTHVDPPPPARTTNPHVGATSGSPWLPLTNPVPINPGAMILLTDGTVLVQDQGSKNNGSSQWWRFSPDSTGSYADGTWTQVASLPSQYAPLYFASAVLPDGRVIIEGGEYNKGKLVWTNLGAIYDPVANTWTLVKHPKGSEWSRIGDAPSTVLANGQFMVGASGYSGTTAEAILNATTLKWKATGSGKADGNGEEGWSLLPNGDVLTVDTTDESPPQNTEIYNPSTGAWTSAGTTPTELIDGDGEVGPELLMPTGSVLATGATGANALYNTATGTWSPAPSFPVINGLQYDIADGPGAVLPDGNVLLDASPGDYTPPAHFFLFDGTTLTQIADAPNAVNQASNYGYMLVLPTGQVLFNDRIGDMELYSDGGAPHAAWLPKVTSVPTTLTPGTAYTLSGKQLGGLTQASAYGDDFQNATNYPLVRLTNTSGVVVYARTVGMTKMSVAPGVKSSVQFTLPSGIASGPWSLEVVANGIASAPVQVTVT